MKSNIYLGAGGSKYRNWQLYRHTELLDLTAGTTYEVEICIDSSDLSSESDETNNCVSDDWLFDGSLPDLSILASSQSANLKISSTRASMISAICRRT